MFLIVDSGSSKSDWVLLNNEGKQTFYSTIGFNPIFQNENQIIDGIKENRDLIACVVKVTSIYFYGAGCSSHSSISVVENALKKVFENAKITVQDDLVACAYATYQEKPCISCIIGTGSNSSYFDGKQISQEVPALGYVLGDEASGSYFGKQLLAAYLYKQFPKHIEEDFQNEFHLTKEKIIENVYLKPNANVYLASFMKFISKHSQELFFKRMIYEGMKKFMEIHVCCYENYKNLDVHFVGSIASIFKKELQESADELDIKIGQIIEKPIEGLVNYHLNKLF